MQLSRQQRWILSNQYRILEALYPAEADDFRHTREAIERGYEQEYDWESEHIYGPENSLSPEECITVIHTMSMFEALERGYDQLTDKGGIEPYEVEFAGFDGNNETEYMGYARHYCEGMGGRFHHLKRYPNFNSHAPTLDRYRRMLGAWQAADEPREFATADDMRSILAAGRRQPGDRES